MSGSVAGAPRGRPSARVVLVGILGAGTLLSCGNQGAGQIADPDVQIEDVELGSIARTPPPPPQLIAFPGAVGYGAAAAGGRGGEVIPVDNLDDSGPGSFRACVTADKPRVCVFRVGGIIRFTGRPPIISSPYLTIAGETAPGDGITLAHSGGETGLTPLVVKNTHDIIIRDIRSRPDVRGSSRSGNDAVTIENSRNVIVDHISGSWALDENINSHRQSDNVTISSSIFAEGIPKHDKCALLSSDPTGPQHLSFVGNLCAHNGDRNPDVNFWPGSCVELVNNIFYDAASQFTEVWESFGGTPVNIVGNYYRAGPSTHASATGIDRESIEAKGPARIFLAGNRFDGDFVHHEPNVPEVVTKQPVCPLTVAPLTAVAAYESVLGKAGAQPRDSVDRRIIAETRSRTGRIVKEPGVIGPMLGGQPYVDSDGDGMSDRWEVAHGTNPHVQEPWKDQNGNGYPNLVEFLDYAHQARMNGQPVT